MTKLAKDILDDCRKSAWMDPEMMSRAVERKYGVKVDPKVLRKLVPYSQPRD